MDMFTVIILNPVVTLIDIDWCQLLQICSCETVLPKDTNHHWSHIYLKKHIFKDGAHYYQIDQHA